MLRPIRSDTPLVLGSGSPRRKELLAAQGIPLDVRVPGADETERAGEDPGNYLARVVSAKLEAATRLLAPHEGAARAAVLAADTIVLDGTTILGKPESEEQASEFVRRLAGRTHHVWTAFAVGDAEAPGSPRHLEIVRTEVTFRALDEAEVRAYVAVGEGRDKAGGYAVQGVGAALVARIVGSYTNVVGLPIAEVVTALRALSLR